MYNDRALQNSMWLNVKKISARDEGMPANKVTYATSRDKCTPNNYTLLPLLGAQCLEKALER